MMPGFGEKDHRRRCQEGGEVSEQHQQVRCTKAFPFYFNCVDIWVIFRPSKVGRTIERAERIRWKRNFAFIYKFYKSTHFSASDDGIDDGKDGLEPPVDGKDGGGKDDEGDSAENGQRLWVWHETPRDAARRRWRRRYYYYPVGK